MELLPILILCSVILLIACENDPNLKKVEQGKMSIVNYNGHSYVVWGQYNQGGCVHNPDCQCKKGD